MRIAYVCADPGVPAYGQKGGSIHVQEVVRALIRHGEQVELFSSRVGGDPPAGLEAVARHALPAGSGTDRAAREQAALAANGSLGIALQRTAPYDAVYERYSLWSFAGMEYARATGVPGVLEVNSPLIEEQAIHRGLVHRALAQRVAERAFGAATVLIAVSTQVAAYLNRLPSARGRVHVVPNGVNPARFLAPRRRRAGRGQARAFTVGFLGSLKPWHGLPVLVEAFALLHQRAPRSRLLIVGDGPERANLLQDLTRRGLLEAIQLTGAVAPSDVPARLAGMDVGVAPYPTASNFYYSPLKVFEYMAAGLPVVASSVGQVAELIQPGRNGVLCPPGDAGALAAALDELRRVPEWGVRLGRAARATVLQRHTWDARVQRILGLVRPGVVLQLGLTAHM